MLLPRVSALLSCLPLVLLMAATSSFAQHAPFSWARGLGGPGNDDATGVAVDAAGNVYVTGFFRGRAYFADQILDSDGAGDVYVTKLTSAGDVLWARRFGGAGDERAFGIAVDDAGDAFVAGHFSGTVGIDGALLVAAGPRDGFVCKLSGGDGRHLWSRRFGGAGVDRASSVLSLADGDAVVVGQFEGTATLGAANYTSRGIRDVFMTRLDVATGDEVWTVAFGGAENDAVYGAASGGDDAIALTGAIGGVVDLGGQRLAVAGALDILVARFAPDGRPEWSRCFGGTLEDVGRGVAIGPDGEVAITGEFRASVDFGGGALVSAGHTDVFVASLSAAGAHQWSRRFGQTLSGVHGDRGQALVVRPNGEVVVAGEFYGVVDFGGGPLTCSRYTDAGEDDMFMASYDARGRHLWSRAIGGLNWAAVAPNDGWQEPTAVALDPGGDIVISGIFESPTDFGDGVFIDPHGYPPLGTGPDDAFVARYSFPRVSVAARSLAVCPSGDGDVLRIELDFAGGHQSIPADSIRIDALPAGVVLMAGNATVSAAHDASAASNYATSITLALTSSCNGGLDLVFPIRVNGTLAGTAFVPTTSPDLDANGIVDVADHALFVSAFAHGEGDAGYNACADFVQAAGDGRRVDLTDYAFFTRHYRHMSGAMPAPRPRKMHNEEVRIPAGALRTELLQNVPNPFNPVTTIRFRLAERGRATLDVFDVTGRRVRVLVDTVISEGEHSVVWDGRNEGGAPVASGAYFYRLRTGSYAATRTLVVLK